MKEIRRQPIEGEGLLSTQIIELVIPPIEHISIGKTLMQDLKLNTETTKMLEDQMTAFENSKNIYVLAQTGGIGDAIADLRQAQAIALARPDKNISIYVPPSLKHIQYTNLPSNLSVLTKGDYQDINDINNSFFMRLSPIKDAEERIFGSVFEDTPRNHAIVLKYPSHFTQNIVNRMEDFLYKIAQKWPELITPNYCHGDIIGSVMSKLLGISITSDLLSKPIFTPESENQTNFAYDMLIVPDALEGITQDENNTERSLKSLNLQQWREIISLLPSNLRYGIVKGTSHPEYCDAVAQIAAQSGKNFDYFPTPTLQNYVDNVVKSKVVVCMDSGTTHIASEVARANSNNRVIREIFNGDMFDVNEYGIRGLKPGQGKILVYKGNPKSDNMNQLSIEQVTQFILSN